MPCPLTSASPSRMLLPKRTILTLLTFAHTMFSVIAHGQAPAAVRAPSDQEVMLYARLMAMTDSRSWDRNLIDSVMASTWAPLRAAGALGVGQVGARGKPGLAILHLLLGDSDQTVASNAAYALGLIHDSSSVPALSTALGAAPRVAREAAWALGEIGAPARGAIIAAMDNPGTDEGRMIQVLLAAAKLRPVPVAELRPYLAMVGRPSVQWAATYAIARIRAPAGVRDLVALAGTPEFTSAPTATIPRRAASDMPSVALTADIYVNPQFGRQRARAELARGLSKQAAGDSLTDVALPVLHRLATDEHPHVRINAVRSLGTYDGRARVALIAASRDPDPNVRIAAAQSLGTVLDSTSTVWTQLWQSDTSLMYRSSLLASSRRAGARLPALTGWLTHASWQYRLAALNAAGSAPNPADVASAGMAKLRDVDGRVRSIAYAFVAGSDTVALAAARRDSLITGLVDRDFYVRAAVIGGLENRPRAADVPMVISTYTRSLADSGNDARLAAIRFIASAWKKDSLAFSPALRRQIAGLRPSNDPLVRAAAESASVFSGWPSRAGAQRPVNWYQNLVRSQVVPALRGQTQMATMRTRRGEMVLELFGADAPITVSNFLNLARTGYYRGTGFHRVVPNFVAQDGDPRDDGNGGPGYAIRDEMNPRRYERGAVGMALSGPDTGGSQYFITHSPQPHLDGHYTVFGRLVRGYAVLDSIVQGDRITSITVQ